MKIFSDANELQAFALKQRAAGHTIGVVPTMGALHEGHLSLVKAARAACDIVIVSVFVNPTQFGPNEDFDAYPRTFEADCKKLEEQDVDAVFHPAPSDMYPAGYSTYVEVTGELTKKLCGARRPGHFRGVATVVTKLFLITQATEAFFGQKDAQQVAVIQRFVSDLNIPIHINRMPIIREESGLARSSRNAYLNEKERCAALVLSRSLKKAQEAYLKGERQAAHLKELVANEIQTEPMAVIDYVELVTYPELEACETISRESLLAIAVQIGQTRLIDNIILGGD